MSSGKSWQAMNVSGSVAFADGEHAPRPHRKDLGCELRASGAGVGMRMCFRWWHSASPAFGASIAVSRLCTRKTSTSSPASSGSRMASKYAVCGSRGRAEAQWRRSAVALAGVVCGSPGRAEDTVLEDIGFEVHEHGDRFRYGERSISRTLCSMISASRYTIEGCLVLRCDSISTTRCSKTSASR